MTTLFYGDPDGSRAPPLTVADKSPPVGVVLVGDRELHSPLHELAAVFSAGVSGDVLR